MGVSTKYDGVFRTFAPGIPVEFARALGYRESRLNPRNVTPAGATHGARGLMQVVSVVREDYNRKHGTRYSADDLFDVEVNVRMWAATIGRIVKSYARHPDPNLATDWTNPEFVKLVVAGWNSGYSEAGGVGRVAKWLEARAIRVTHDAVFAHAGAAGATRHLQNDAKQRWQRTVVALYLKELGAGGNADAGDQEGDTAASCSPWPCSSCGCPGDHV